MPFIPAPDTAQVEVIASLFGQIIENILYFSVTGGFEPTQIAQLAATVADYWSSDMLPHLSDNYTLLRVEAKDISSDGQPSYTNTAHVGESGAISGGCLPGGSAFCVSFRSGLSGRSYRGRNFIGGIPLSNVSGNQVLSAWADPLVAVYAGINDAVDADLPGVFQAIVSRFHLGAPRTEALVSPVVSWVATDYNVDAQRRRLTGRGT